MLLQSGLETLPLPPEMQEIINGEEPSLSPWLLLWYWALSGPLSIAYLVLLVAMIVYAVRNDPNWGFWLWIMLIAQPIGAIIYFVVRYLPSIQYDDWSLIKRWKKIRTLPRLESAATQIGNPYQFVLWGDALREVNRLDQAATAYARALAKEPGNLMALWGAARIGFEKKRWAEAKELFAQILQQDPHFKFGDVSLFYAKCLLELQQNDEAFQHLQQHVRKWRQPEALYLLGSESARRGETAAAREQLQGLLSDLQASPRSIARKSIFWKSRASRLLRSLPRT